MGRGLTLIGVVMLALPAACSDVAETTKSGERPPTSSTASESSTTSSAAAATTLDVELPVPGLLIAVGTQVVDISGRAAEDLFEVKDGPLLLPPIALESGLVVVVGSEDGSGTGELRVLDWSGALVRTLASRVGSVAVNAEGTSIGWGEPAQDGRSTVLSHADAVDGRIFHRLEIPEFATVVGFADENVVLSVGDGAEASAAVWVPPSNSIVRARENPSVTDFGRAIDTSDGTALLTIGDGVCLAVADVTANGFFANAREVPCGHMRGPPLGAVSPWLSYQYVAATVSGIAVGEFDTVHNWNLDGELTDLRPIGPADAVVVARTSNDTSVLYFCHRRGCSQAATVTSSEPVRLVRRTSATAGPIEPQPLALSPLRVRPGGGIEVRGTDQCPKAEIVLVLEPEAGLPEAPIVGRANADREGAFTTTVRVPDNTEPGAYRLQSSTVRTTEDFEFDCMTRTAAATFAVER